MGAQHARGDEFFIDGVSAGDVTASSAVLWTRADAPGDIHAVLATNGAFTADLRTFAGTATPATDNTVKIDVAGLAAQTAYYFRFVRDDNPTAISRVGQFRTAPSIAPAPFRFVFTGDSNYELAPFTAAGHALDEQPDFLIWFGDTIYGDVPSGDLGTATTLADYRAKYRQIRSDPFMRNLLGGVAVYTGWDDHEVYNDYAGLDPSVPIDRKLAGYQAFFEYMPIRPQGESGDPYRTYRRFQYGPHVEFFFLDERQYREASAAQACENNPDPEGFLLASFTRNLNCQEVLSQPRQMLGPTQLAWIEQALLTSTATTKFVVNNVPLTHIVLLPYDRWDGYDAQRRELLEFIDAHQINGVVFLTTDTHANVFNPDVTAYFRRYRPDYQLPNGVVIPEIIAGPIGTETLRDELLTFGAQTIGLPDASVFRTLLSFEERLLVARLRDLNQLTFIADDQIGYAVFEVTADGGWQARFRGMSQAEAQNPESEIQTLYSTDEGKARSALPCCWPMLVVMGGMIWAHGRGNGHAFGRSSRSGVRPVRRDTTSGSLPSSGRKPRWTWWE